MLTEEAAALVAPCPRVWEVFLMLLAKLGALGRSIPGPASWDCRCPLCYAQPSWCPSSQGCLPMVSQLPRAGHCPKASL